MQLPALFPRQTPDTKKVYHLYVFVLGYGHSNRISVVFNEKDVCQDLCCFLITISAPGYVL